MFEELGRNVPSALLEAVAEDAVERLEDFRTRHPQRNASHLPHLPEVIKRVDVRRRPVGLTSAEAEFELAIEQVVEGLKGKGIVPERRAAQLLLYGFVLVLRDVVRADDEAQYRETELGVIPDGREMTLSWAGERRET